MLGRTLSRFEVVSTDFVLPAGTVVQHDAGAKFYTIADPKARTYVVMDSQLLLSALEGQAGVINSQFKATPRHTPEEREIAGYPCRHSIVTISYVASVPFESDRILVQQKCNLDVWHTARLVSDAVFDHLFFKFQQDKTGAVQKVLTQEIGFPMEVTLVVTPAEEPRKRPFSTGSFHMIVTELKEERALAPQVLEIPPVGHKRLEKNPYFQELVGTPVAK